MNTVLSTILLAALALAALASAKETGSETFAFESLMKESVKSPNFPKRDPAGVSIEWDACYQLYMPNSMYPSLCLSGTMEEGIGGAGVRLAIFHVNAMDIIEACAVSSALAGSPDSLEFIVNGRKEVILKNVKKVGNRLEGDAVFGKKALKFISLDAETYRKQMNRFHAEPKCRDLAPGSLVIVRAHH